MRRKHRGIEELQKKLQQLEKALQESQEKQHKDKGPEMETDRPATDAPTDDSAADIKDDEQTQVPNCKVVLGRTVLDKSQTT